MLGNVMQMEDMAGKLDDSQLAQYMRDPNSPIPAFLLLAEMKKRKDMRAGAKPEPRTVREAVAGFAQGGYIDPRLRQLYGLPPGGLSAIEPRGGWSGMRITPDNNLRKGIAPATPPVAMTPKLTPEEIEAADAAMKADIPDPQMIPDEAFSMSARGAGGIGNINAPTVPVPGQLTQEQINAMLPAAPQFQAPSLDKSIARGAEVEQRLGFDFSKAQKGLEERRGKLAQRRADDKNMALLRAGLGIMGGTSPYAATNIGRGAMAGVDYLAQAQEAQRREEQAIADQDLALARQAHSDKLQYLQLAAGEQAGQVTAANQGAQAQYTRGLTGLNLQQQRERDIAAAQQFNAEAGLRAGIANQNAQAAALRASRGGLGDGMQFDSAMVRPVFETLMERDQMLMQELTVKEKKGKLTQQELATLSALRSPDRMQMLMRQAYQTVMGAGGLRSKRTQTPVGGIGGGDTIDMTTR